MVSLRVTDDEFKLARERGEFWSRGTDYSLARVVTRGSFLEDALTQVDADGELSEGWNDIINAHATVDGDENRLTRKDGSSRYNRTEGESARTEGVFGGIIS